MPGTSQDKGRGLITEQVEKESCPWQVTRDVGRITEVALGPESQVDLAFRSHGSTFSWSHVAASPATGSTPSAVSSSAAGRGGHLSTWTRKEKWDQRGAFPGLQTSGMRRVPKSWELGQPLSRPPGQLSRKPQ